MKCKVIGREVYDEGDVLLAQGANSDVAQYVAASLDLMSWVRAQLAKATLCIRINRGEVEVGDLLYAPDGFVLQGRAKTIDAAVRAALAPSDPDGDEQAEGDAFTEEES